MIVLAVVVMPETLCAAEASQYQDHRHVMEHAPRTVHPTPLMSRVTPPVTVLMKMAGTSVMANVDTSGNAPDNVTQTLSTNVAMSVF